MHFKWHNQMGNAPLWQMKKQTKRRQIMIPQCKIRRNDMKIYRHKRWATTYIIIVLWQTYTWLICTSIKMNVLVRAWRMSATEKDDRCYSVVLRCRSNQCVSLSPLLAFGSFPVVMASHQYICCASISRWKLSCLFEQRFLLYHWCGGHA